MTDSPHPATPLLLLPGLICDARIWAPQVEGLRGAREVIAINGYGEADSLGAMAEQVLAKAPPRFIVAGHSMGGRVALEVLRRAPERRRHPRRLHPRTHRRAQRPPRHGRRRRHG